MLKFLGAVTLLMCCMLSFAAPSLVENMNVQGYWQIIDDHTHLPTAVMQVFAKQGKYYGRIAKIYSVAGDKPTDVCHVCKGDRHDKPILGMILMQDMQYKKANFYDDGKILDPKSGHLYSCNMRITDAGQRLKVRGYFGFTLLGRTQTWLRLRSLNDRQPLAWLEDDIRAL